MHELHASYMNGGTTMMKGQKTVCGAKTRSGASCRNIPMRNGRCRLHGGKSTGPRNPSKLQGNRNAAGNKARLTTGEFETITWDTLNKEEQQFLREQYNLKIHEVLNEPLEMEFIRQARMLKRTNRYGEDLNVGFDELIRLENAMTRVSGKIAGILDSMYTIQASRPTRTGPTATL